MEKPNLTMVQNELLRMGELVQKTMRRAIQSLKDRDEHLAREIINQDDIIDNFLIVMEDHVAAALAEGPTTKDLRRLLANLKISNNLERIADYASNIAELVLEFKGEEYIKPLEHIPHLSRLALDMLDASLKAFVEGDADLAEAVCKRDDEADDLHEDIHHELLRLMDQSSDPRTTRQSIRFLLISGYLERIADHATNIGEETIYSATGKRVQF
ncbi:MAG TPA: phosphate signaling complex protein PhoU [Bacillota bacterium]|jgi:phosphate transport system protein|nr:phosphate signaling complex protein PhoU [Bacillota bacterium]